MAAPHTPAAYANSQISSFDEMPQTFSAFLEGRDQGVCANICVAIIDSRDDQKSVLTAAILSFQK
jgi:hypothetical protein